MLDSPGRSGSALMALALLVSLLVLSSCNLGGNSGLGEANTLNQSASEDIREIEQLVRENKDREGQVTRALNAGDLGQARQMMDDSIKVIDRGLEKAESAASKFDRASKLDIDPTIKEYLSFRSQSVNKAIEAFKELRLGIIAFRDSTANTDKAATEKAKNDIRRSSVEFDRLINESEKLGRQADEIARRNPDKIKPG
jgi:hypothetical protein